MTSCYIDAALKTTVLVRNNKWSVSDRVYPKPVTEHRESILEPVPSNDIREKYQKFVMVQQKASVLYIWFKESFSTDRF